MCKRSYSCKCGPGSDPTHRWRPPSSKRSGRDQWPNRREWLVQPAEEKWTKTYCEKNQKLIFKLGLQKEKSKNLPNVAKGLHKVFPDKSHCAVRRRRVQVESTTAALSRHARTCCSAAATAAGITGAAAASAWTTAVSTASTMFQMIKSIFRVDGRSVIGGVELVHLVQLLVTSSALFVAVCVQHTILSWGAERQSDDAVFLGNRQDRFGALPILGTQGYLRNNSSNIQNMIILKQFGFRGNKQQKKKKKKITQEAKPIF